MSTLTADEMARIKSELDDNVADYGAQPYLDVRAVYDVIRDHVVSSSVAPTTSSTAITAAGPTTITLASATDYAAGQRVVIDCDDAREVVTIRSLTGAVASIVATKTHSGTYPVEVESGLTIVRGILSDLITLDTQARAQIGSALGLKRVDEVEWNTDGGGIIAAFASQRVMLRRRLASATGLASLYAQNRARGAGVGGFEAY